MVSSSIDVLTSSGAVGRRALTCLRYSASVMGRPSPRSNVPTNVPSTTSSFESVGSASTSTDSTARRSFSVALAAAWYQNPGRYVLGALGGGGEGRGMVPAAAPAAALADPPQGVRAERSSAKALCCLATHDQCCGNAATGSHAGGRLNASWCARICDTHMPGSPGFNVRWSAHSL